MFDLFIEALKYLFIMALGGFITFIFIINHDFTPQRKKAVVLDKIASFDNCGGYITFEFDNQKEKTLKVNESAFKTIQKNQSGVLYYRFFDYIGWSSDYKWR